MRTLTFVELSPQATHITMGKCHSLHGQWTFPDQMILCGGELLENMKDGQKAPESQSKKRGFPVCCVDQETAGRRNLLWMVGVCFDFKETPICVCLAPWSGLGQWEHNAVHFDSEYVFVKVCALFQKREDEREHLESFSDSTRWKSVWV